MLAEKWGEKLMLNQVVSANRTSKCTEGLHLPSLLCESVQEFTIFQDFGTPMYQALLSSPACEPFNEKAWVQG